MLLGPAGHAAAGGLQVGDILVSDIGNGTVDRLIRPPAIARSSRAAGSVRAAEVGSGVSLVDTRGIAIDTAGNVIVADATSQLLFSINPVTGDRTVLAGGGVGSGV